jgi:hypothetical protein
MRKTTASLLLAGALASLPTAAYAGKGGGSKPPSGSSSTIRLVNVDAADTVVNHGDTITFEVSTTATSRPAVEVSCHQGGVRVYLAGAGFYPEWPWTKDFTMASGAWTGGAADCSARLYSSNRDGTRTTTLATLAFHVEA